MRVLVTGATGFVGRALLARAASERDLRLRCVVRPPRRELPAHVEQCVLDALSPDDAWSVALDGIDAVLHLAARVHQTHHAPDALAEYRRVNVAATAALARRAARAGVRRFVFLSSVKVHGDGGRYHESDAPTPVDAYGISKSEAEAALRRIGGETSMEIVIVRPPLVYGPFVSANFRALVRAVSAGLPLPLGAIRNRRSLVGVDNLVDFILTCLRHPAAADEIFFVSDGDDLSTTELVRQLARALGRPARLFPVPAVLLMATAAMVGRVEVAQRLVGTLQVDIMKARRLLGWTPPFSVGEGLRRLAEETS